jgi:large subunit ribosomal protein L19e
MMNVQKKIASRILKCGAGRVWMDPRKMEEISQAITRRDVRALIRDGVIRKIPEAGISSGRKSKARLQKKKGLRKGRGSRKGYANVKKNVWMRKIRSLRSYLKGLRSKGMISNEAFRDTYDKSKSGLFKSKAYLKAYLERNNLLKQPSKK